MERWWQLGLIACLFGLVAQAVEDVPVEGGLDYGFEGTLDRMDARFAPTLREGLVLSGVYSFLAGSDAADADESMDQAVYPDAVGNAELTFDRNHVWVYEASAGSGGSRLDLTRGVKNGERSFDLYAVTLPLKGELMGDEGWAPRWLQLWLYGPEKEMLTNLLAQPPPESFARGWWRITFWNGEGTESATAEGRLTASGEAGSELNPSDQIAALEGVVVDLNRRLETAEQRAGQLEAELASTRKRVDGLQSTIDLLVEERENLRAEVTRLEAKEGETPAALEQRIAELEANAVLAEEREVAWTGQNRALVEALSEAEDELARLQRALARAEETKSIPVTPFPVEAPPPADPVALPAPPVPGPVLIVPAPQTVTEVSEPLAPTPVPAVVPSTPEIEETIVEASRRTMPFRAGKFRRGRR